MQQSWMRGDDTNMSDGVIGTAQTKGYDSGIRSPDSCHVWTGVVEKAKGHPSEGGASEGQKR